MKKLFLPILIFKCIIVGTSCKKETANQNQANSVSSKSFDNAVSPNLVFEETFENANYFSKTDSIPHRVHDIENCNNGSVSPDNTTTDYGWTLTRVTAPNPIYEGMKTVKFEIRKDQPLVGSIQRIRSEVTPVHPDDSWWPGPDAWYSYAMYIPAVGYDNDTVKAHEDITQWTEDGGDDCIVEVIHGRVMLEKISPDYPTNTSLYKYDLFGAPNAAPTTSSTTAGNTFVPAPRNEWHTFVFHFIHSWNSDGLIEIWRDGTKLYALTGKNMHTTTYPKFKIGIYKADWTSSSIVSTTTQRILYFDNVRVGKPTATLSDMSASSGSETLNTPTVNLFANSITVQDKTGQAIVTVVASSPLQNDMQINYTTSDGTAFSGTDYYSSIGTVTIPSGQDSANIIIKLVVKKITGQSKYFYVKLLSGATFTSPQQIKVYIAK